MKNLKVYENFLIKSPGLDIDTNRKEINPGFKDYTKKPNVTPEQEAIRNKLESDVKRMYPKIIIKHSPDGQSGTSVDNIVIYATDHYDSFNAFLFGLVMGKIHGSEMPAKMASRIGEDL